MESANLHHQHQLQDQLVGSSSLSIPTCYGVGTTNHAWTPTITVNTGNFNPNSDGVFSNPRDSRQYNDIHVPSLNSSMVQDLGFHWISNAGCFTSSPTDQSAHDLHLAKIKEELSESIPKFTEMLNSSSSIDQDYHLNHPTASIKDDQKDHLSQEFNEKLLMKTVSSRGFYSNSQNLHSFGGAAMPSRGNFSQIYPSINISNVNQSPSPSAISSSLDMNLHALDLLTSERYSGSSFSQLSNSHDSLGVFKDSPSGLENMQQLTHRLSSNPSNISLFTNRVREAKRPGSLMEAKSSQAAPKKPRLESRASCPPFKVRKEKLGDRIAALQQLVAPFGKTDTASVLMEAIGYIKFLQSQVETLSVPYMKSSRNKTACRTMQVGLVNDGNEEPKRDLRSRGLCLVPLSCMSYVTGDSGGGGVWPPTPNYGGGT